MVMDGGMTMIAFWCLGVLVGLGVGVVLGRVREQTALIAVFWLSLFFVGATIATAGSGGVQLNTPEAGSCGWVHLDQDGAALPLYICNQ
jgi:hypothetical protein